MDHIIVFLNELQTKGLVPSNREHIERNLATNRVPKVKVSELCLERLNERSSNIRLFVKLFKLIPLFFGAIAPNWTHIDHAVPKLNECAPIQTKTETCQT